MVFEPTSTMQTQLGVSLDKTTLGSMAALPRLALAAVKVAATCAIAILAMGAVSAPSAPAAGGTVVAWGGSGEGELGNGVKSQNSTPVFVCAAGETAPCTKDLGNVSGISAGERDGMALLENASVMAWGQNIGNILGQGEGNTLGGYSDVPVAVCAQGEKAPCGFDLKGVKQVSVGESSALALLEDGEVLAWGGNEYGQLGNGKNGNEQDPAPEPVCAVNETVPCAHYLTGVREIAAGDRYAMALLNDGEVVAWGYGGEGAIGRGNDDGYYLGSDVPAPVCAAYEPETKLPCLASKQNVLTGVKKIAAATTAPLAHSFALLESGEVVGWGANGSGQLGTGTTTETFVPVDVKELAGVTAITAYDENSMALLADGKVKAWGNNAEGQLGNGTKTESKLPEEVPGLEHVTAISGGYNYSLALLSNETVEAWGEDEYDELGNGGHTPAERSEVPIAVCAVGEKEKPCKHALQHVTAIAGMGYVAIAVLAAKPEVSTQPNSATVAAGESVSFTAEASGNPKPTVQWFVSKNAGKFEEVAGATSDTLTIASARMNESGNVYYAVFTNDQGTATSASATLTLRNSPPVFTAASPPLTVAARAPIPYTFTAVGNPTPTFSLAAGAPSWLTINPATGALEGAVPPETTNFDYSVIATNSHGSQTAGPFFTAAEPPVLVTGTVKLENGEPVAGTVVDACISTGGLCYSVHTTSGGDFSVDALAGTTIVLTAYPPDESVGKIAPAATAPLLVPKSGLEGEALTLESVEPPSELMLKGYDGSPSTLYWQGKTSVSTKGCAEGIDTVSILGQNSHTAVPEARFDVLEEAPPGSGTYSGALEPLYPMHGAATIDNRILCVEKSALTPSEGPSGGGTTVDLAGRGFTSVTGVYFGSTEAPSYKILSSEAIEVVAPEGSGTVPVTVTEANKEPVSVANYTYITVAALSPTEGPTAGGTVVRISGGGLGTVAAVRFGESYATVVGVSATEVEAESPPGTGTQDISVETESGIVVAGGPGAKFTYTGSRSAARPATGRLGGHLLHSGVPIGDTGRLSAVLVGAVHAHAHRSDARDARRRFFAAAATTKRSGATPDGEAFCPGGQAGVECQVRYFVEHDYAPDFYKKTEGQAFTMTTCTSNPQTVAAQVLADNEAFITQTADASYFTVPGVAGFYSTEEWHSIIWSASQAVAEAAAYDADSSWLSLFWSLCFPPPPPPLPPPTPPCPPPNIAVRRLAYRVSLSHDAADSSECKKILIDPSGTVLDANGSPVPDASVSILRSETWSGPFGLVSPESAGIEPAVNPETTEAQGIFQWEVDSGFYEVQATAPECTAPGNPSESAATIGPYPVPPPQVGLTIRLACADEAPAPAPTVTSLSASTGPTSGGTRVTVLGTGFAPESRVMFGSAPASVTYVGPEDLEVVSPTGDGSVEVHVQTAGGTSANTSADTFFYGAPPTVTGLSVHEGPTNGGTRITVTGTEFSGATVVGFGGVPGESLVVKSSSEIEVTAPEGRRGTVAVIVTTPAGFSEPSAADEYTYVPTAPVCSPVAVSVPAESAVTVPLSCSGQEVVYNEPTAPAHGTLSELNAPGGYVLYTPAAGYNGADSFTYTAHNAGGTSNGATVSITVETTKPVITKEPQSTHVAAGATASFTAEASGAPKPGVQWQRSTNRGVSWSTLGGATSTALSVPSTTVSESGYEYRAEFTNAGGHATSSPGKLTVTAALPAVPELGRCVTLPTATGKYKTSACTTKSGGEDTGKYEWESGPGTKAHFSSQNKTARFETTGKTKVNCVENKLAGEYTGPQTISLSVTFTGCEAQGALSGKCQSPAAKAGEIVTGAVEGQLGVIKNAAKPTVGWVLEPTLGDTVLSFECGLTAGSVTNAVITPVSSVDKMSTKLLLKFKASKGKQEPEAFEAGLKNTLNLVTTSIDEQLGLTMSDSATGEEPLEIKAIV